MKDKKEPFNGLFRLHRNALSLEEQVSLNFSMLAIKFRPCPKWLGNFRFAMYREGIEKLPVFRIQLGASRLRRYLPNNQTHNTLFIQKYEKGEEVKPHRDPKNNRGYTAITVFGNFEGAETIIEGNQRIQMHSGDVLVLRCNHNGLPRPLHRVSPVTKGIRYALIINQIEA